jgi:hypothetical protein
MINPDGTDFASLPCKVNTMHPVLILLHSTDMDVIYVRPDGSLCIAPVVTDDSGTEELDEI